jgi:hypothetical protein
MRKAAVVAAVDTGLLSEEEACRRYGLALEELLSWQIRHEQHGVAGLRTDKIKEHRVTLRARRSR